MIIEMCNALKQNTQVSLSPFSTSTFVKNLQVLVTHGTRKSGYNQCLIHSVNHIQIREAQN